MKNIGILGVVLLLSGALIAHANTPVLSVQSLNPGNTVSIGSNVTFYVSASGFTNTPNYSLNDTFVDGTIGNANINSSGNFSWTPSQNDVGSHTITITVSDTTGLAASTVINLNVTNTATPTLSIGSVSPSSNITDGTRLTFNAEPSGLSGTPTYSVTDSFSGSTISNTDVNSYGDFFWTPAPSDDGQHTITMIATDPSGNTARSSLQVVISSSGETVSTPTTTTIATPVVTIPVTSVATAPVVTFTEDLALGSSDAQVTALQQLLTAQGDFTGSVTGYYGSLTQAAVIKFQAAHSIAQLGIVGPSTRTALNALETAATAVSTTAAPTTAPSVTTTTTSSPTITEIRSEIQSLSTELSQIESQLSQVIGQ